jgi:hypothetical protein
MMSGRRWSAVSIPRADSGAERRSTLRYTTAGTPILIAWGEGDGHQAAAGSLINISLGGCAAQVTTFPPKEGALWIRLTGSASSPWTQASVVEMIKRGSFAWTRRVLRIRFIDGCPYELFKAAIEGFAQEVKLPDFKAEGYSVRDWH